MSEERIVNPAQDAVIKVLVLGDAATGKSSIIRRYVYGSFVEHHQTTIGVDFSLKAATVNGTTVRVQLWDIAGQEHFRALSRVYYKDALAALLVYDISSPETFESVLKWKKEIETKVELPNHKPLPVVLCGNKSDLTESVDRDFLTSFSESNGFTAWFDTSAKANTNIDAALQALIEGVLKHQDIFERKKEDRGTIRPMDTTQTKQSRLSWCCNSF